MTSISRNTTLEAFPMLPRTCRHCCDTLPDGAPSAITSCRADSSRRARVRGDMLPAYETDELTLCAGMCALTVAIRYGLPELPNVP